MNNAAKGLAPHELIAITMREYEALYGLVTFRMASLDRRIPLIAATLTAFLSALTALPQPARTALLFQIPVALYWLFRTTANHARSFEDVLARLEEIECQVNSLAGSEVLLFQSRHPSRSTAVGGRTGTETVASTFLACVIMLAVCGYLAVSVAAYSGPLLELYGLYLVATLVGLLYCLRELRKYRYQKQVWIEPAARREPPPR